MQIGYLNMVVISHSYKNKLVKFKYIKYFKVMTSKVTLYVRFLFFSAHGILSWGNYRKLSQCKYFFEISCDSEAVSYTHLDVYKRQPPDRFLQANPVRSWSDRTDPGLHPQCQHCPPPTHGRRFRSWTTL